tara:strand:+ start:2466 stop:2696 length:231 start_codon:yes stop_codon:yes gene_type:complete
MTLRNARELGDSLISNLGTIKQVLKYNATEDKFELANIKTKLQKAIEDDDLPDNFVEVAKKGILSKTILDYGSFEE